MPIDTNFFGRETRNVGNRILQGVKKMLKGIASVGNMVGNLGAIGYNIFSGERNYSYQKDLQERIFQREDTAVQRRKADLIAAGFNPVLAAGDGAGSGSVVQTVAPQVTPNNLGDALLSPFKTGAEVEKLHAEEKSINQGIENMLQEIKESNSRISKNDAETVYTIIKSELTQEQIKKISSEIDYIKENVLSKRIENDYKEWENTFWRFSGFPPELAKNPLISLGTLIATGIRSGTTVSTEAMKQAISTWIERAKQDPEKAVKDAFKGHINVNDSRSPMDRAYDWIYGR